MRFKRPVQKANKPTLQTLSYVQVQNMDFNLLASNHFSANFFVMGQRFVTRRHGMNKVRRGPLSSTKMILWIFLGPLLFIVPIGITFWSVRNYDFDQNDFHVHYNTSTRYNVGTDHRTIRNTVVVGSSVGDAANTISAIILTYKSHEKFERLLHSTLKQQLQRRESLELVIADSGCLPETKEIISRVFSKEENKWLSHKYIELCHNPGYAIGNNEAVKIANRHSEWVLFLNDDIIMQGEHFIASMLELGMSKSHAVGAVGCTLRSIDGNKLQESGSIVWRDGSAAGYGRGREDLDASDLIYPHPVDYVSGACIMVKKDIFDSYGGFDHSNFPNYYEDTDLQLHIQHDMGRQVWLQPKAIALHDEHGSFGAADALSKMEKASIRFREKLESFLSQHHLPNPYRLPNQEMRNQFLRAADLHARNPVNARILYLHLDPSNQRQDSGFDRAYENLSMMVELCH